MTSIPSSNKYITAYFIINWVYFGNTINHNLKAEKSVAEIEFEIKERDGSDKGKVKQEIKYKRVQIKCPKTKNFEPVELTIVIATEIDPPEGNKGIEWILLTSLDISTAGEALVVYILGVSIETL